MDLIPDNENGILFNLRRASWAASDANLNSKTSKLAKTQIQKNSNDFTAQVQWGRRFGFRANSKAQPGVVELAKEEPREEPSYLKRKVQEPDDQQLMTTPEWW
ncbi:hypothetical protein ACLOJK_035647 [Asimina triloba]